jgi:hypothetical protein
MMGYKVSEIHKKLRVSYSLIKKRRDLIIKPLMSDILPVGASA